MVSIIIPVYRSEAYLEQCIASLCSQTCRELELIFVNDASPDGSAELLAGAQARDSRIRVITFPENRGVSAARNAGIDAAQGEFIGFCDSDDWMEAEMVEQLLSACRTSDCDASFCRVFKDRPNGSQNVPLGFPDGTVFDRETIESQLLPAMIEQPVDGDGLPLSGYTPRNLFSRRAIGDIRFREDIHFAEDLLFIAAVYRQCSRIAAVDRAYYHYRFYEGSVTKRYSPYVPDSFEQTNLALDQLLGDNAECQRRMQIRRRKNAVESVRNACALGSPFSFPQRVHWVRQYMHRADIQALFRGLTLRMFSRRTAIRLGLMKYRLALVSCILYTYVFQNAT